ncbi:YopX family protein [Levilactobacillus brevis]|uniref:YopX family protein n=1 Tax=Levilactobacillus brevis TaxID=1580 RepID=UPI000467286A|nr:YopX family protein [Levilactobacillus brevis]QCZ43748.1 prophage Lp2 protein 26 [Levilactobacillus brevis]
MVPKFRAWDKKTKEYFHVSELWNSGTDPDNFEFDGWTDNFGSKGRLKDIVIEQSTGLKDANGKEIYEGDVVHFRSDCLSGLGIVKWNETGGAWEVEDIRSRTNKRGHRIYPIYPQAKYRIDGNVHENPELLEAQHD